MASEKLKNLIQSSYGIQDRIFAGHAFDEESAKESIKLAIKEGLSRKEFQLLHENYLSDCTTSHKYVQLTRVMKFLTKKWKIKD